MQRFVSFYLAMLLLGAASPADAGRLELKAPPNDAAIARSSVTIAGEADPAIQQVALRNNGEWVADVPVINGRFQHNSFALAPGANVIEASANQQSTKLLLFRVSDVTPRSPQFVLFDWQADVEEVLKDIARKTVNGPHGERQLDAYAALIKTRTAQIFLDYYRGVADVRLVSSNGPDVTTININPVQNAGTFGRTAVDCRNASLRQPVWVYADYLRLSMRDNFAAWEPMRRDDTLPQRANDVAESLARTAAHELGHAFGLTANAGACGWMEGDPDGHNSEAVHHRADYHHLPRRFNRGWHVMDYVSPTDGHIRIGHSNRHDRSAPRRGQFERFSASYLSILHPLP